MCIRECLMVEPYGGPDCLWLSLVVGRFAYSGALWRTGWLMVEPDCLWWSLMVGPIAYGGALWWARLLMVEPYGGPDCLWWSLMADPMAYGGARLLMVEPYGGPDCLWWSLMACLLYTSDAADEEDSVDLGGRRIIKKNTDNS